MKITNSNANQNLAGIDATKSRTVEKNGAQKSDSLADSKEVNLQPSKVNLSERAQMMQKAKEIAMNAPDENEARILELQRMIDEGTYQVDAGDVADKLLNEHLMFPD